MAIVECKYKLDTTTQTPRDTIEWFHRVFLVQLATSRTHRGLLGYHPVLAEQHLTLLMVAVGVTADAKVMVTMREKAVKTSCEAYLACNFILLSNCKRYNPLRTHLENRHTEGKNPHPVIVEEKKTIMVEYNAPGVVAPKVARKDSDNQGLAFAKT